MIVNDITRWQRFYAALHYGLVCICLVLGTSTLPSINAKVAYAQEKIEHKKTEQAALKAPDGFEVQLFADDTMAHDIFSMTVNSHGEVVVAGPGYIRVLVDDDHDGRADRVIPFSNVPANGSQGMFFDGNDLFCVGDKGLLRLRDENGDRRADGKPQLFLNLKTGAEHHAHAVRRGPDGWLYVLTGNMTGITSSYATLPTSPIKKPNGGVLLRLNPTLSGGELFADGFRNAYDFDFGPHGEVYAFDSDGERDITLPWYRQTRLYQCLPGSDQGWKTTSWKEPESFLTMPPVTAKLGRGSPTGVVCYRHTQFPQAYQNSLFVEDWTYGRVMQVALKKQGAAWKGTSKPFLTARGQHGFAPTDIAIGKEGEMYVAVGGRGTQGGVYQIRYKGFTKKAERLIKTDAEKLKACLNAPQPLSSWSRANWIPLAKALKEDVFIKAAKDRSLPVAQRIRALEIMTELFHAPNRKTMLDLSTDPSAVLRARAIWAYGRKQEYQPQHDLQHDVFSPYLLDKDPLVVRAAIEALQAASPEKLALFVPELIKVTGNADRYVRFATSRLIAKLSTKDFRTLADEGVKEGWDAGHCIAMAFTYRHPGYNAYAIDIGLRMLKRKSTPTQKRDAVLLIQIGLGTVTPKKDALAAAYDGYTAGIDLDKHEKALNKLRTEIANLYPTHDAQVDHELLRVIAMATSNSNPLLEKVLARLTPQSEPVDDIHTLIVASRISAKRELLQRDKIANALVMLDAKIRSRKLPQDSHWQDRMSEIYTQLAERDPQLPSAIVAHKEFGMPAHIPYLAEVAEDDLQPALKALVKQVQEGGDDYPWTNSLIFVLSQSEEEAVFDLIREQKDNFALRSAVLIVLAEHLDVKDRAIILEGLDSSQFDVIEASIAALKLFPNSESPQELITLFTTARRLNTDEKQYAIRDQVMTVLQRNSGKTFGFVSGKKGYTPQAKVFQDWNTWLKNKFPKELAALQKTNADWETFEKRIEKIDWSQGDLHRGEKLFTARTCVQCHGGGSALGPDLAGIAGRFSRKDIFIAIVDPHRNVSPRYQTVLIGTNLGKVYTGMIVYESVDGLLLRNSLNQTFRIETKQIAFRKQLKSSLMPTGLLNKMKDQQLADLYTYLRSLSKPNQKKALEKEGKKTDVRTGN